MRRNTVPEIVATVQFRILSSHLLGKNLKITMYMQPKPYCRKPNEINIELIKFGKSFLPLSLKLIMPSIIDDNFSLL
jgi:hypothetical protein